MDPSTSNNPTGTKVKPPVALINPKKLTSFLRLCLGHGVDAVGFVDGKAGRILGWEDVDEERGRSEVRWLVISSATEGVSTVKGNRIGCISAVQGRFTLVLVSFGATCSIITMQSKMDEMKQALETQFQSAITAGTKSSESSAIPTNSGATIVDEQQQQ